MTRCLCSAVGIQPGLESVVRLISLVLEDNSNVRAAAPVTSPIATIITPATPNNFVIGVHTFAHAARHPRARHRESRHIVVYLWPIPVDPRCLLSGRLLREERTTFTRREPYGL